MKQFLLLLFSVFIFSIQLTAQSTASKNVETFSLQAPQLDTIKKIWVYLPESYKTSDKKYPVIYMHDAQNLFDNETSYVGEWKVDEVLDNIENPEAIIVGIEHGGNKRIDELTPYPHEKYGGGKGNLYLDFITKELKPYIDTTYRTIGDYRNTGIFGSSLGGLISFYAALTCPDTFGMVGVYSPSFWFNDKIYDLAESVEINPETRFYFLVGTEESEEMIPDTEKMLEIIRENGSKPENIKVNFVEGGKHNEKLWSENFKETYLWLMDTHKS